MMTNYNGIERRKHPRYRVQKNGKLVTADLVVFANVQVFELSVGGARLLAQTVITLPRRLGILFEGDPILYPSRLRWQTDRIFGVEFVGEPVLIEPHKS
jgi:hypothetical protein